MQQRASEGTMTDELYEQYAATILRYLRQHTATREDAEDILVDVFVAALEDVKFAQFCEQEQRAWLWRVARNKLVDAFRRSPDRRTIPLEQIFETVEAQDTQNPEWLALHQDDVIRVQRILSSSSIPNHYQEGIENGIYYAYWHSEHPSIIHLQAVRLADGKLLWEFRREAKHESIPGYLVPVSKPFVAP